MKITSVKELEKLLKLCRKQGVTSIKMDGVELSLGPLPKAPSVPSRTIDNEVFPEATLTVPAYNGPENTEPDKVDMPDALNPEQMLFYSTSTDPATTEVQ